MAHVFAVVRSHGAAWKLGRPLEEQDDWPGHADFMDALHADGVILFAGPLAGTTTALIVMRAEDEAEIERRLAPDPWTRNAVLVTTSVNRWLLRIGTP